MKHAQKGHYIIVVTALLFFLVIIISGSLFRSGDSTFNQKTQKNMGERAEALYRRQSGTE